MASPPLPLENLTPKIFYKNSFKSTEIFEFTIENKKYILKISYNEEILQFFILEVNIFSPKEYILYSNIDDLKKTDKFFNLFESIEEVFISLKNLKFNNNLTLIKEGQEMKIEIANTITNKKIYINIPIKETDINTKVDNIINYINSLNKKIVNLEIEVKNAKNENVDLKKIINISYFKEFKAQLKTLIYA